MNLLVADASSENISLCITRKGKIEVDFNRRVRFGGSLLINYIDKNLQKMNLDVKDFDAFVIGAGPGSFTGLRISFSLIKAFMMATGKPAISISSFFSCAYPFRNRSEKIAVVADARKNLIYLSCFQAKQGHLKKEGKEKLVELKELRKKKDYLFVTYDARIRERVLETFPNVNFYPKDVYPKAKYLLPAAENCYNEKMFCPVGKLEPLYLHPKTCQIRKKQ